MKELHEFTRFDAVGNDGKTYVVIEKATAIVTPMEGGATRIRRSSTVSHYFLEDGTPVDRLADDPMSFKVRGGDLIVRKA